MTNQEFEQLKRNIQFTATRLSMFQAQYRAETGCDYVITGPRPDTRETITINYLAGDPHDRNDYNEIEFIGDGVGAKAIISEVLEHVSEQAQEAFEAAMSKEAAEIAADEAEYKYEDWMERKALRRAG